MKVGIVCVEAFKVAEVIYAFRVVKVNVVVVVGIVVVVVIVEVGVVVVVVVVGVVVGVALAVVVLSTHSETKTLCWFCDSNLILSQRDVEQFTESCNPALTSLIRNTRMIASFKGFLS